MVICLKPDNDAIKQQGNELNRSRDSTYTIHHEREIVKERTKTNINNIFNERNNDKKFYTKDDSTRIRFIDSFFLVRGMR